MMPLVLSEGDRVCFNAAVIRRTLHAPDVVAFVGTVRRLICDGKVAEVQSASGLRSIPTANLAKVTLESGVVDTTW